MGVQGAFWSTGDEAKDRVLREKMTKGIFDANDFLEESFDLVEYTGGGIFVCEKVFKIDGENACVFFTDNDVFLGKGLMGKYMTLEEYDSNEVRDDDGIGKIHPFWADNQYFLLSYTSEIGLTKTKTFSLLPKETQSGIIKLWNCFFKGTKEDIKIPI